MELKFEYNGTVSTVTAERMGDKWMVTLPDGSGHQTAADRRGDGEVVVTTDDSAGGERVTVSQFLCTDGGIEIFHLGHVYRLTNSGPHVAAAARARKSASVAASSGLLTAPMVGTISEVLVAAGDKVAAGQTIASIGSMKVYVAIESPFAGTVTKLFVSAGTMVAAGDKIAQIASDEPKEG